MSLEKNSFIAMKSIFDLDLHNAINSGNRNTIEKVFQKNYKYEIDNNMISNPNNKIDISKINEQIAEPDDFSWAM